MEYKVLSDEQRAQMLKQRIAALEQDHFGHTMNLDGLTTVPDSKAKTEAVKFAEDCQASIEAAHEVAVAELEKLEAVLETPAE